MSIKIKRVEINGIRGNKFSEMCKNSIDIDGKTLLLYGSNGDGKSTLYDSLEWALTDNIEEIKNRQMKEEEKYNILKNKFCTDDDVPYVYIGYEHNGDNQTIKRELKPWATKFPIEDLDVCFIDLGRIERFVVDTKGSLWNRFSNLLGLEVFNDYITRLERLYNELKRKVKGAGVSVEKTEDKIRDRKNKLKELETSQVIGGIEIDLRKIKIKELYEEKEFLKGKINSCKRIKLLLHEVQGIKNDIRKNENELNRNKENIEKMSESLDIEVKEVIKATRDFLSKTERDVNICPVCQRGGIVKSSLVEKVEDTWNKYEDLDLCEKQVKGLTKKTRKLQDELEKREQNIIKELDCGYFKISQELDSVEINIIAQYIDEYIHGSRPKDERRLEELERIYESYETIEQMKELDRDIRQLKKDYETKKQILEKYNQIQVDTYEIISVFSKKMDSSIKSSLENISKHDVTYIYNQINGNDFVNNNEIIDKIKIEADVESKEIVFQAKFNGIEKWSNPIEFLSTGHLRCLGFAILIAQAKRSGHNFYVFDDPIASIDFEHRYCLINYLNELSAEGNQLIVTTSDLTFYEIMQHTLNQKQISYRVVYDMQCGSVFYKDSRNYLEEAKTKLSQDDLRAASLYLRLYLETYISNIADKLKVKIVYKRDGKISHMDMLKPCRTELKRRCKSLDDADIPNVDSTFNKLTDSRYFKSIANYPLNQMLHYPREERPIYCKREIGESIDQLEKFTQDVGKIMHKLNLKRL